MPPLCSADDQCLNFFPGMGFRPAVHAVQRDQYGEHLTLVVGDDSPLEGKVPPGYDYYTPALQIYPGGAAAGPVMAALTSATPGGGWGFPGAPFFWAGTSSSTGGRPARPPEETSLVPPEGGLPPIVPPFTPITPDTPLPPTSPWPPTTEIPVEPIVPPLHPVPLPDAAPLLVASLLAFAVLRRALR